MFKDIKQSNEDDKWNLMWFGGDIIAKWSNGIGVNFTPLLRPVQAEIRTSFEDLYRMMSQREEFRWMMLRIKRMAEPWVGAIRSLAAKQNLAKRRRKKVGRGGAASGWHSVDILMAQLLHITDRRTSMFSCFPTFLPGIFQ